MKVLVVAVGRPKGPVAEAIGTYEERAGRYWKLETREVDTGAGRNAQADAVREAEAARILNAVPGGAQVVVLTRKGRPWSSSDLARYLGEQGLRSTAAVAFVVGGAFGVGQGVLDRAHRKLSLSALTLPHDLARLVLAEQLYRAGTLLRGEPYHKGTGP